jgi:hypothetical protein
LPIHKISLFKYLDLHLGTKTDRLEETDNSLNTMATTLEQTLRQSHDWAVDRIHYLSERDIDNAYAIQSEFSEWLNPEIENHDIYSLEYIGEY